MNKITLQDFMECVDHNITDTDKYLWSCYGKNTVITEYWNGRHGDGGFTITAMVDIVTQNVCEMQAWDYKNDREYRWFNPDYKDAYILEAVSRGIDPEESSDGRKFIDLDVAKDILEKSSAIVKGEEYDSRLIIQLDLSKEDELYLMRAAHDADMSLNKFLEMIIQKEIDERESEME